MKAVQRLTQLPQRCGFTAAVAADKEFHSLEAPVARVAIPNTSIPFNRSLERHVLPDADKIIRAIKSVVK